MAIVIKDVSMTEELGRKAQTAVRGGVLGIPRPWERYFPIGFPSPIPFPVGYPGVGGGESPDHIVPAGLEPMR